MSLRICHPSKWDMSNDSLINDRDKLNRMFIISFFYKVKNLFIKPKIIFSNKNYKQLALPIKKWDMDSTKIKKIRIPKNINVMDIILVSGFIIEDELDSEGGIIVHSFDFEYKNKREIIEVFLDIDLKRKRKYDYISLERKTCGFFDNSKFSSLKINRGWLSVLLLYR